MESVDVESRYHYLTVAKAIAYIREHYRSQPSINEVARHVNLSPFQFHKLFSDWAGTTPKSFLQYVTIEHTKRVLAANKSYRLADTAAESGLSGTSRLHDLFITIEGMTPTEYRDGGVRLAIKYSFSESPFGRLLIASTEKGICHLVFVDNNQKNLLNLKDRFPHATFTEGSDKNQKKALSIFENHKNDLNNIKLHLKGTDFQMKVWRALLSIPYGSLTTYSEIAQHICKPNSQRAIGTAIGRNSISYLIPCHRVIKASGEIGGYMWGTHRKAAIIAWEASKENSI
ncbi:MAG: methylated-DNA--[protein]-cysteine S-methyltransferase [Balneolaceae bacterium]|nr:MAG: methylated-DNA--[protein]-cysteine S-methyltransferase [Balneolaceae bacterium]